MTKVFFDTEFTGLHQGTTLISIGLISEYGDTFYAEFGDYDHFQVDDWLSENVISKLRFHNKKGKGWCNSAKELVHGYDVWGTEAYGNKEFICSRLKEWFFDFENIEIWSDFLAYDWVLLNQLWGHALKKPDNVYYIPFDICTVFKIKGIDPDINREEFSCMSEGSEKHNSLWDARVIKACYEKLMKINNQ